MGVLKNFAFDEIPADSDKQNFENIEVAPQFFDGEENDHYEQNILYDIEYQQHIAELMAMEEEDEEDEEDEEGDEEEPNCKWLSEESGDEEETRERILCEWPRDENGNIIEVFDSSDDEDFDDE